MFRFLCGPSFTKCGFEQNPAVKKIIHFLGGELSFGLQRERRGCSPLYYRGTPWLYRLRTIFQQFSKVFSNKILNQNSVFISSAGNWTAASCVIGGDTHHYTIEELHVSISLWTVFHQMWFWTKSWSKKDHSSPRRGIVFRSPAWEAGMLTTILPRNCVSISFAYHFSPTFQRYFQMKSWTKKSVFLPSGGNWTRSLALQAGILITILSRNYMLRILCGPSFTKCGFE